MHIFTYAPSSWQDLQSKVGQLLKDIGYDIEIEKSLKTARGTVSVDVYAENTNGQPKQILLCECKYWNSNVRQEVIYGFRQVVNDFGANFGYVISKKGFQSGAFETIANSNLELFTWDEFESIFTEKWLLAIIKGNDKISRPLATFVNPLSDFYDEAYASLSEAKQLEFKAAIRKYSGLVWLTNAGLYTNSFSHDLEYVDEMIEKFKGLLPVAVNSYSDYFYFLRDHCLEGINAIDRIFGKRIRKQ